MTPKRIPTRPSHRTVRRAASCLVGAALALGAGEAGATVLLGPDDFETGANTNWTPNNDGSNWSVNTTSEAGNDFYSRVASSTAWSDATGSVVYGDVVVQANVRINSWNTSTQNRVYLFARMNNGSSTDTTTAYMVSIAPDSSITLERRDASKNVTALASSNWMDIVGSTWNPGVWNLVRLEVSGSSPATLAMYVNGVQLATATDSTAGFASGNVGFGTAGASADFDDVMVGDTGEFDGAESGIYARFERWSSVRPLLCESRPTRSSRHVPSARRPSQGGV